MKNIFNLKQAQIDTSKKRKFRASIYIDIFVPETNNLENDRKKAKEIVENIADTIPNSYVGGVAWATGSLDKPFDKDF